MLRCGIRSRGVLPGTGDLYPGVLFLYGSEEISRVGSVGFGGFGTVISEGLICRVSEVNSGFSVLADSDVSGPSYSL